jgi:hypothetical protein
MPKLSSQKEIESYTGISLESCKTAGYPLAKIAGRWQSHTDLIDDFIKIYIQNEMSKQKHNKKTHVNTL